MTRAIYKVDFQGTLNDTPVMNSFYVTTQQSECTFEEAKEIGDGMVANGIDVGWKDCLSDNYTLEAIRVRGIVTHLDTDPVTYDSPVATAAYVTFAGIGAGTRVGAIQSNQSGPLISYLPTIEPGERARVNKIFLPGINEADGDDDLISGGLRTALESLILFFQTGFSVGSGPVTWVAIIKRVGVAAVTLTLVRAILAWAAESFIASQRNRRPRLE